MTMADKIIHYVEQGMTVREIHTLHPEWNYKTIHSAMYRIKTGKYNPKKKKTEKPVEKPVERPKGWNKDRKGCRKCKYRNGSKSHTPNGCNYIMVEGHSRGCKVEDCTVFKKGSVIKLNPNGALKNDDMAAGFEVE